MSEESFGYFYISSNQTFSNDSQIIRLRRRRDEEQSTSQEGVWRCSVPSDASGGRRNIYFGLYTRSEYVRSINCVEGLLILTVALC